MEGRPSQKPKTIHVGDDITSINVDADSPLDGPPSFEHGSVAGQITTACTTRIRPSLPADIISIIAALIPSLYSIPWSCVEADSRLDVFIDYAKTALAFSQISRLFREVALHTQTLWSRIYVTDFRSHIFLWELFLARSRMAPLYVIWDIRKDVDEEFDYGIADFALLFKSQQRWKELYLYDDVCFYKIFSSFIGSDDMPTLPALEVLSVPEPQANKVPFLTPNLKHLSTDDPIAFEILAPTLVSCRIGFPFRTDADNQEGFDGFKEFLGMCPLLERLWIVPDDWSSEFDHEYIDLPSVKTLRVDSFFKSLRSLGIFLQSMHMANLETFEILLTYGVDASFADLLRHLEFASHVRSLTLVAEFTIGELTSAPFRLIDERFSSVSSLAVSCWARTDQIRGCHFPHLRRLVVESLPREGMTDGQMLEDARTTVEDVLEFLQNRSHIGGEEDYEPFHLILYGYGPAAGDEEIKRIVSQAGDKLVLEAYPYAELFCSLKTEWRKDGQYL